MRVYNSISKISNSDLDYLKTKSDAEIVSELSNYTDSIMSILTLVQETKEHCIPKQYETILDSTILSVYPELRGKINGLFKSKYS